MRTPQVFLAYAPRGVGLCSAVVCLKDGKNVYGWFTGPHNGELASAYFLLEQFYARSGTRFLATEDSDPYGGWTLEYTAGTHPRPIGPEPVDDALSHELVHLQDAFVHEWLFHRNDPGADVELAQYAQAELAVGEVNIRFARLSRLSKLHPNWTYYSRDFERSVASYLMHRWPLEYRAD